MKTLFLILCFLPFIGVNAQIKEGRIIYERVIQLSAMFRGDPNISDQIPKTRTDQFELLFANNQTLWQLLPSAVNENPGTIEGNGVVLRFAGGGDEVSYQNIDKGIRVDQREVADRNFIVSDTIAKASWKLSDETDKILGYTVHKAIAKQPIMRNRMVMENGEMKREQVPDTIKVVAWYTPEIPVSVGPDFQGQLPGAILKLEMNNSQTVFRATEVSAKSVSSKIKEPKDGKKMTVAQFIVERDKIMEEMRKNMPQGRIIRMSN